MASDGDSTDLARTLAAVIDEGTFDAAARRLHITPSAVSQRVKSLEQQLGRVLVVRSKPTRPTDAGAAIMRLARQMALLEHDAIADFGLARRPTGRPAGRCPLAVNADSLGTWFLPALARVVARHPVVFDLHRDDQDFTAGLLESGTVMAAVTSQATPVAGCLVRPLGVMRYEAVATPGFARLSWRLAPSADRAPAATPPASSPPSPSRPSSTSTAATTCSTSTSRPAASTPIFRRGTTCRHRTTSPRRSSSASAGACCPAFQPKVELERGDLVRLGGSPVDVPLFWQQWNLRSPLLDAIAER